MAVRRTQPPLYPVPCIVCSYPTRGEHEPWCPQFLRGEADDAGEQLALAPEPLSDPETAQPALTYRERRLRSWMRGSGQSSKASGGMPPTS